MNLKNICLILLIIGILAIGAVSAEVKTTVNGVDFVLDDNAQIISEDGNYTNFKIKDGMTGYIVTTSVGDDLNSYILNDTDLKYSVMKVDSAKDVDEYAFVDGDLGEGYFLAFKKDNKDFIYLIQNEDMSTDSEITFMAEMMSGFPIDNKDLKPI